MYKLLSTIFGFCLVLIITSCGPTTLEDVKKIIAKKGIPDGEIILLASASANAVLILNNQTMEPENVDFELYVQGTSGVPNIYAPTVSMQNVESIEHSPFYINWSGGTDGIGYLYSRKSMDYTTQPEDLILYRTRSKDITSVNLDFEDIKYEKIK